MDRQQREAGRLRLDDPVSKHLDWFDIQDVHPDDESITIRRLLTHSSGLPRESDFPYWTDPDYPFPTREQIKEKLGDDFTEEFMANCHPASKGEEGGHGDLGKVAAAFVTWVNGMLAYYKDAFA